MRVVGSVKVVAGVWGMGEGEGKYSGIAAGPDGKLYCSPQNATNVLVIDPLTGSISFIEGSVQSGLVKIIFC